MVETRSSKAKAADSKDTPAAPSEPVAMEIVKTPEELKAESDAQLLADIKQNIHLLDRAVATLEGRFTTRALRATASIRKRLNPDILAQALNAHFTEDTPRKQSLLEKIGKTSSAMDVDAPTSDNGKEAKKFLPEHDIYLSYLVLLYLHDQKQNEKGMSLANELVQAVQTINRRTLDQLAGRIYFYYARFYELADKLTEARPVLLAAQRTATLRHDDDTQATILNLLLRSYLHFNLYEQADKLVSKAAFPEDASNNQMARHMYYLGRIKAMQLDYTVSHRHLLQAIRKGPTSPASAGFQQAVNKLAIIVQLLMGEIPDRAVFRQPILRKSLLPYLQITQAVRVGDLAKFQETLGQHAAIFRADKTYTLILRLRHNVIKTGVRMISLSYSRISLKDICLKLQLDSEEDAEHIVAKSIRDGVIDASIDHERGFMKSRETKDLYSTAEPQAAFNQRIAFCLNLHNESVRALRFPREAGTKDLENAAERLEEERKLAKEIVDGELEDDDMGEEW
ncbi:26S proteasome non-ATPase regulatory subunit [Geranomyces michiganensis]|nr:26S proteasome non-ATPase regulatory subunit [Geranomyces michiganensis]